MLLRLAVMCFCVFSGTLNSPLESQVQITELCIDLRSEDPVRRKRAADAVDASTPCTAELFKALEHAAQRELPEIKLSLKSIRPPQNDASRSYYASVEARNAALESISRVARGREKATDVVASFASANESSTRAVVAALLTQMTLTDESALAIAELGVEQTPHVQRTSIIGVVGLTELDEAGVLSDRESRLLKSTVKSIVQRTQNMHGPIAEQRESLVKYLQVK